MTRLSPGRIRKLNLIEVRRTCAVLGSEGGCTPVQPPLAALCMRVGSGKGM